MIPILGHLIQRAYSLEKTLMLVKVEGRRRERQRTRWLGEISDSLDMSLSKLQEMVKNEEAGVLDHKVSNKKQSEESQTDWKMPH